MRLYSGWACALRPAQLPEAAAGIFNQPITPQGIAYVQYNDIAGQSTDAANVRTQMDSSDRLTRPIMFPLESAAVSSSKGMPQIPGEVTETLQSHKVVQAELVGANGLAWVLTEKKLFMWCYHKLNEGQRAAVHSHALPYALSEEPCHVSAVQNQVKVPINAHNSQHLVCCGLLVLLKERQCCWHVFVLFMLVHRGCFTEMLISCCKRRTQQGSLLCYARAQAICFSGQTSHTAMMLPRTEFRALSQPLQQMYTQVEWHDGSVADFNGLPSCCLHVSLLIKGFQSILPDNTSPLKAMLHRHKACYEQARVALSGRA